MAGFRDNFEQATGGGGGVTDHGALTGLADDDHTQYHNDARGDSRYKLKQAQGAFAAVRSAGQLNIATVTFTKVECDAEEFDVSGWYDPTTNFRYTPQLAGYYAFTGAVQINPGVNGARVVAILYKNGTRYRDFGQFYGTGTAAIRASGPVAPVFANGTTDYFELWVWHDFGVGTSDIQAVDYGTFFTGYYLGT